MASSTFTAAASEGALTSVQLLNHRGRFTRLDVGPFCVVYIGAVFRLISLAAAGEAESLTWSSFQLGALAILHILLMLFTHWSVAVQTAVAYVPARDIHTASAVKVQFKDYTKAKELAILQRRTLVDHGREIDEHGFEVRKQRYVFNFNSGSFEPLQYPVQEPLSWYLDRGGYERDSDAAAAITRWGPNLYEVPLPLFSKLLKEQLLAPFFVFQVFCVSLWCMDEYWMYSVFTLFMLIFFECTVAGQRLRNVQHLRSLSTAKQAILVYRCGKWEKIPGEHLIPGDLISIGRPLHGQEERVVPADALLVGGTCIVDESVLTGESTPQWKSPVQSALESGLTANNRLDLKRDKAHTLFGGTKILQHASDKSVHIKTPDGGCLAVVLQTGFETAQGRLMRTILYSSENVTANNWETGLFILFLLVFAVAAAAYVLYHGLQDPTRPRFKLFLSCSMIITSVIPPELPMELSIAVNHSLMQLAKQKVFCTEPFRIPFAGKVDICCFDKTGTLTDDSMILEGIVGCMGGSGGLIHSVVDVPIETSRILATCHSLVVLEGDLIGDPLEKAAFQATGWSYSNNNAVSPRKRERAQILHRFHFSAQLKRMSAVVRIQASSANDEVTYVVTKGAPEVIETRLKNKPATYREIYKRHAAQGGRVIALGFRVLDPNSEADAGVMRGTGREDAETGLEFGGFAVFQCPLKKESDGALRMLKDSSHQLVMITGDAPLTACHAAGKVHIVTRPVLILTHLSSENQNGSANGSSALRGDRSFVWMSPDEKTRLDFSSDRMDLLGVARDWDLCITGDTIAHLEKKGVAEYLIPMVQVFARVAPEHKEMVVNTLRQQGRTTLMCGDGTNDVGGLKAAHVGVALLCPSEMMERVKKKVAQRKAQAKDGKARDKNLARGKGKPSNEGNPAQRLIEELERQGKPVNPTMRKVAEMLEDMDDGMAHLVKPGDASMAAPFTAKKSSVMPCTDLIRQGRSTLVSTVQMFKILGLMSLSSAYSLSVMDLAGVKIGGVQATVTGLLSAAMFFFLSNSKPLDKLSTTRPHPNIFCFYVFLSVLGQFAIHMVFLIFMYNSALATMPPKESQTFEQEFKPNLVNTVCFIVNFIIQIITFAVNYAGAPFVAPISKNMQLYRSLVVSGWFCFLLVLNVVPGFVSALEMVPIPNKLRAEICSLTVFDFLLTFALERMLRAMFPASLPPDKGYMAHKTALKKLERQKKRQ